MFLSQNKDNIQIFTYIVCVFGATSISHHTCCYTEQLFRKTMCFFQAHYNPSNIGVTQVFGQFQCHTDKLNTLAWNNGMYLQNVWVQSIRYSPNSLLSVSILFMSIAWRERERWEGREGGERKRQKGRDWVWKRERERERERGCSMEGHPWSPV